MCVLNSFFFPVSPTVFIDVGLSTYPGKTTQHSFIPIFIMGENIYYGWKKDTSWI